jgi:putative flippase GtrA
MKRLAALFAGRTDSFWIQLWRYTLVGGVAFGVDFGFLYYATEVLGFHYLVSAAMAFGLGLMVNYCISIVWVFSKRTVQNRGVELCIFALLGVLGLGINELVMYVGTDCLGLFFMYSKVVATGFTYAWNFLSRKVLLFTVAAEECQAVLAPAIAEAKA